MPEPYIGRWCNLEPIDVSGVPVVLVVDAPLRGCRVMQAYEAQNGGRFNAVYQYKESRESSGAHVYELCEVTECFPPTPPQLRGYGDDVRLPMMDEYGYSVHAEAERRRREWGEVLSAR